MTEVGTPLPNNLFTPPSPEISYTHTHTHTHKTLMTSSSFEFDSDLILSGHIFFFFPLLFIIVRISPVVDKWKRYLALYWEEVKIDQFFQDLQVS